MDSQKQKFFIFLGAIVLMIIAIIATPLNTPKLPISLLSNVTSTTTDLVRDELFQFTTPTWTIDPVVATQTASGARIVKATATPVTLSQSFVIPANASGLRLYFDGSTASGTLLSLQLLDSTGKVFYTSPQGKSLPLEDEIVTTSVSSPTILRITVPANTEATLREVRVSPLFSATR